MIILIDTRENKPFTFSHSTLRTTLTTGDYSVVGMEKAFRLERKGISDLWGSCGPRRERFRDQLRRLSAFPYRLLVVEGSILDVARNRPVKQETPWRVVARRLASWSVEFGVPVWFMGQRSVDSMALVEDMIVSFYDHYTRTKGFPPRWGGLFLPP